MDKLQAGHAGSVRPPEGPSPAPEGPDDTIRGGRGSLIRMRDMDPLKDLYRKLRKTDHRMLLRIL